MWHFPVEQQSLESISARGMLGYETFQGTWVGSQMGRRKAALWGGLSGAICPIHPDTFSQQICPPCPACSGLGQLLCLFPLQGSVAGADSRAPTGALAGGNQALQAAPGQKIRLHVADRLL